MSHIPDIVAKIQAKACVLFLGAAVHAAPPDNTSTVWLPEQRPPIGDALSRRLAARSGFTARYPLEDAGNLPRVALDYELQKQRGALVEAVRQEVQTGKCGSPLLNMLARMAFPVVITTNYDTHFEDALRAAGMRPFVSSYKSNVDATERSDDYPGLTPTPEAPLILKIHGDIERNAGSMVLTEEDYIQFVLRMSDKAPYDPVPEVARLYMAKGTTLFLGYSLRDYNLRLLFKTLRWKIDTAPPTYSVDFKPDPLVQQVLEGRGGQVSYIVQDVWHFVPALTVALQPARATA